MHPRVALNGHTCSRAVALVWRPPARLGIQKKGAHNEVGARYFVTYSKLRWNAR